MRKNLVIVFLSLTFLIPAVSHAARDYGRNPIDFGGGVYLVLKYGEITIADDVPEDGSDIRNLGFAFGKQVNDVLAMEFEYTATVSEDGDYGGTGSRASADTVGFFVVARTPGDLYAKGRLGYTRVSQEFSDNPVIDWGGEKNVYGIAAGVSVGYKIMKGGAIELEYMLYPTRDDVEFDFSGVGGPVVEEDLEMDFVAINYVWSFE
ncbi:MAG: outer membrane beta-barrel protein [Gammaproteobacteria bacterium]|nr:outer membrane beta-barrel protein [Gammaproteobacteria bacterium]